MENSIILQNVTTEQLLNHFREIVREEIEKNSQKEPAFLTRKEVCKLFHITLPTLNTYTRRGMIKSHRLGSRILYAEADLQEALKELPIKYRRNK